MRRAQNCESDFRLEGEARQMRELGREVTCKKGSRESRFYRRSPTSSIRVFYFGVRSIKMTLCRRVDHSIYVKTL